MVRAENLDAGRHVVQFYGRDEELADRVTDYLLGALDGGGVAVVIATPEHQREFETRLGQAGVDLAGARDDGSYLALDAGQMLSELMVADKLDSAAFDRVTGAVIAAAGAGGRPGQPEVHHRDQALPPGQELGLAVIPLQQRERLGDVAGAMVAELGGLHELPQVRVSADVI